MSPPFRVCVLGGGIIGMSSAVRALESGLPGTEVTVVAEDFTPNTTGDGAAGFWNPYLLGDVPRNTMRNWCEETFQFLLNIARGDEAVSCGVGLLSAYQLRQAHEDNDDPDYKDLYVDWRDMTEKELALFSKKYKFGKSFTTVFVECTKLLPHLMKRFQSQGGILKRQKINSLNEFLGKYDVVINCPGVNAAKLVPDPEVYPIRGQVIRVKAPWIKFAVSDKDFHILPNAEFTICGGTHQEGNWNTDIDPVDRDHIWKGCQGLVPSLKHATIVKEWVGLRPGRCRPRIERETLYDEQKKHKLEVVHNYGHGGSGITLFWGCAKDTVDLLIEVYEGFITSAENKVSKL